MEYYEGMRVYVDTSATGVFTSGHGYMVYHTPLEIWVVRFDDYTDYMDDDDDTGLDCHSIHYKWVVHKETKE